LQLIAQPVHEQGYALDPGSLCRAEQVPARHHNNIFWVQDETRYVWGGSKDHRFENNLFYGTHADGPEDARAVRADPMFAGPVRWGAGLDSLTGFTLRPARRRSARGCRCRWTGAATSGAITCPPDCRLPSARMSWERVQRIRKMQQDPPSLFSPWPSAIAGPKQQ
jgi:hypothetical protein